MSTTEAMEAEFEQWLDLYEAHLMKALCEHYGLSRPEQPSEAGRKGRARAVGEGEEAKEVNGKRDQLLEVALLSEKEIESWVSDITAMQEGKIPTIVGSDFWERAKTEMVRRQVGAQIRAANALVRWTVVLAIFTGALVVVTAAQQWMRCR